MRQPNSLLSIAATRSAAVVLHGASSVDHSEATNRVIALYADGSEKLLDTNVLGYPIGDPLGEIVAWSTKGSREGDTTVTAFDTAKRRVVGDAPVPSGFRVFAVDRETVYLSDLYGTSMVWNASTGGAPQPFAQAAPGIVTDASSERVIVAQGKQTVLLRQNGEVAQQFDKVYLGTFSPSGQYASLTGQEELLVWDVAPAREIALKLPAGKSVDTTRWSPDNTLVVRLIPESASADAVTSPDAVPSYVVCRLPSGDCDSLPKAAESLDAADGVESSAMGQLGAMLE